MKKLPTRNCTIWRAFNTENSQICRLFRKYCAGNCKNYIVSLQATIHTLIPTKQKKKLLFWWEKYGHWAKRGLLSLFGSEKYTITQPLVEWFTKVNYLEIIIVFLNDLHKDIDKYRFLKSILIKLLLMSYLDNMSEMSCPSN